MILSDKEALTRLHSPSNLMNRLKDTEKNPRGKAMSLFGIGKNQEITQNKVVIDVNKLNLPEPTESEKKAIEEDTGTGSVKLENLIDNADAQLALADSHNKAANLLKSAVEMLTAKIDDIDADKLPSVINAASKVVNDIRRERNEATKNGQNNRVNIVFYTPVQKQLSDYSVIDV